MEWMELVANLINGVLVLAIVQYLKNYGMSWLKINAPWSLPIIAMFAAQLLNGLAVWVGGMLGYPIDFTPIINVLIGALAVTTFDVKRGFRKAKLRKAA